MSHGVRMPEVARGSTSFVNPRPGLVWIAEGEKRPRQPTEASHPLVLRV